MVVILEVSKLKPSRSNALKLCIYRKVEKKIATQVRKTTE